MKHFAIVVAGGRGTRMNSSVPKQFLLLDKIPVLMRSLHAFHRSAKRPEIVLVLPADLHEDWMDLCHRYRFHVPHLIAEGGSTRFQSVRNGLEFIRSHCLADVEAGDALIAVHDGARPFIDFSLIDRCYEEAAHRGAVTLGIPSTDSLRLIDSNDPSENQSLPREQVMRLQTPQTFRASILFEAYQQAECSEFTDDTSVVEKMGIPISILEGDPQNIKLTFKHDFLMAEAMLRIQ